MKAIHHTVSIIPSSMWKPKCAVVILLLILGFELEIFFEFDELAVFISKGQQIVARFARQTSYDSPTTTLAKRGHLNLHLFSETCASDLDILCNFPMFPNAPDNRLLLNTTNVTKDLIGGRAGLRLFGFITPAKSGLYTFTVKFCHAEVWLSHSENWRNSRKVLDTEMQPKRGLRVSSKLALVAGNKYFIEVVSTCYRKRNKIQLLWKTPMSSAFEIINGSYLSHYVDDTGKNHSLVYDDLLPDSLVCASRRNNRTYFKAQPEISYLSHDEVKDILPYCEYNPSYIVNYKMNRFQAVTKQVVHSFIYPFPEHMDLKDQKYWIYPLGVNEARNVVDIFTESLHKRMPG